MTAKTWSSILKECVMTFVTTASVVAILLVTANDPSSDDATRGLVAGVLGSLFSKLSRQLVG